MTCDYPCVCRRCKRRSEPRPLGVTPSGWTRDREGFYLCATCSAPPVEKAA